MSSQILICLAGLITGILFSCGIPGSRFLFYLIPLLAVVAGYFADRLSCLTFNRMRLIALPVGFVCFFMAGWVSIAVNHFEPGRKKPGPSEILATVVSYREVTDKMAQLVVSVGQENAGEGWGKRTGKMVLLMKPDTSVIYRPGDLWYFGPITIMPVSPIPSKSGFIPQRYWLSRGVRYEARLAAGKGRLISKARLPSITGFLGNWQQTLCARIDRIALSEASRALIKAMVLGDRSDIEKSTMTDFSRAGIIHVISVSGLHVGIIYFIIAWVLKRVVFTGPMVRSFICLLVVWVYTGITGFSPSANRSAGMITLFEFARVGKRGTPGLEVLSGTAILHCLIDPYTAFDAGAQLSYLAVAGIFLWNPVFNPLLARCNRVGRYFAGSITISLAAQSLITPLLLFWFGWFPLYFLIGNLVLMPLMVVAFYLGLAIVFLDFTGLVIPLLYKVMDLLILISERGAGWLGNLPGNLIKPAGLIWPDVVLYYLILLVIRSWVGKPSPDKVKRLLGAAGSVLIARYALLLVSA